MSILGRLFGRGGPTELAVRKTVTVLPGETLMSIAEREYGDGGKWEVILDRNRSRFSGGDADTIYTGMVLDIPEIK